MSEHDLIKIIAYLWSAVYDLLLIEKGEKASRSRLQIEMDLNDLEIVCRGLAEDEGIEWGTDPEDIM